MNRPKLFTGVAVKKLDCDNTWTSYVFDSWCRYNWNAWARIKSVKLVQRLFIRLQPWVVET